MQREATHVMSITEQAALKAVALAEREGRTRPILRLRVLAGGCSGFTSRLTFEDDVATDDHVIESHGLTFIVDPKSAPIVEGSTLEFNDALLGGGFKINNPRAIHECACGESFSV
jgi:iron-sulfur cluster assembly protein